MNLSRLPLLRLALLLTSVCCLEACALPMLSDALNSSGPRSFLGVRFGTSLAQAQNLYPLGSAETSPYGADAYRLSGVGFGEANYESVAYEFTPTHGMQLVVARFSPESGDPILSELKKSLGTPVESGASDSPRSVATWAAPNGVTVTFDGPNRWLVLIGPYGTALEPDVKLRQALVNE
jgi:hypothetical protein